MQQQQEQQQQQIQTSIIEEACVNSYQQALQAYQYGATRIELCDNLQEGGTTPSYGTILKCKQNVPIPIMCMIRPRGGDFIYSDDEIDIMKYDIQICKQIGVVFGILDENNLIDYKKNQYLIQYAKPLETCFHMAIDETENIFQSLDIIIKLGFNRVLTKGGKFKNAFEGIQNIKKLQIQAQNKITIMPGKGINKMNKYDMISQTQVDEVHGTQIV